jgi:DNA-binding beta-propeller fold protein YncE
MAVSPDGRSVYVTNNVQGTILQYDVGPGGALSPKSPATVAGGLTPDGVAVSPDGSSVYVADAYGSVSQYDVGPGGALRPKSPFRVAAGRGSIGVAVSPGRPARPGKGCGDENHAHAGAADCNRLR